MASRYADLFSTHYGDVLGHLEDLRRLEWSELSPKERTTAITPTTPPATNYSPNNGTHTLTTSQSQPIYVPGKYSVTVITITKKRILYELVCYLFQQISAVKLFE